MNRLGGYKFQESHKNHMEERQPEDALYLSSRNTPKNSDTLTKFELGLVAHYANHFPEKQSSL